MIWKDWARKILWTLHLDVTRNLRYDRLTWKVMQSHLRPESNAIDVGCHKGEVLDWILDFAPQGKHWAFEPLPHLAADLRKKFGDRVHVVEAALSDQVGKTKFQFVKDSPAYSGILRREYTTDTPNIEELEVAMSTLDEQVGAAKIDLIKVDVEGGEWAVLAGGAGVIQRDRPLIIFEFGKGASEYYGTTPEKMWALFSDWGYALYDLGSFVNNGTPLTEAMLSAAFRTGSEYYFVASSK
jgi:FkbM family methyltransferase